MIISDELAHLLEQARRIRSEKRAANDGSGQPPKQFVGAIGNLYGRKQLSPPFDISDYAKRWLAAGIPPEHCLEQIRNHLEICGHQSGAGLATRASTGSTPLFTAPGTTATPGRPLSICGITRKLGLLNHGDDGLLEIWIEASWSADSLSLPNAAMKQRPAAYRSPGSGWSAVIDGGLPYLACAGPSRDRTQTTIWLSCRIPASRSEHHLVRIREE
jgi:hypothetical protein